MNGASQRKFNKGTEADNIKIASFIFVLPLLPFRGWGLIMRIDIISVLPELLQSPMQHSIMKRAQEKKLLEVHIHNLRQWAVNEYGQVDDYQYGGGAGMVMMCEPLAKVIEQLSAERKYDEVIYLTPDGEMLEQKIYGKS